MRKKIMNKVVYRHRRLDTNEIFYVGIGSLERAYDINKRNPHWLNIYKIVDIEVEIIADNLNWEDACELEILLIQNYGRRDLKTGTLVNLTDGGDGTYNYKHTDSHIKNITGKGNHFYGLKHSKESIKKMSETKGFKVINIITNKSYPTIKEAALKEGIDYSWLKKRLKEGLYKNLRYDIK